MSTKLLRKIKNTIPELRKSEKIVAEYILKDPKSIITLKTADASSLMGISEPTLIRFCKAMGFTGYQELKINTNNDFFTDKSLENFLYIELISKIFPKAKFVYCKRNKYANFLGILKVFLPNLLWSHSTQKIINIMNLYENNLKKIINENKIKIKIIELENFSNNPIDVSKDLFNFLGIDSKRFKNIHTQQLKRNHLIYHLVLSEFSVDDVQQLARIRIAFDSIEP